MNVKLFDIQQFQKWSTDLQWEDIEILNGDDKDYVTWSDHNNDQSDGESEEIQTVTENWLNEQDKDVSDKREKTDNTNWLVLNYRANKL